MAALFIVSVPIGNLRDITNRAIEVLESVDDVFAEDTRVTGSLLAHYGLKKKLHTLNEHSGSLEIKEVAGLMKEGKNIAYVSDAGTPGIADPGGRLVETVLKEMPDAEIIPIPGVSAITAALAICGFPADRFVFMGFPPHKKRRAQFFNEIAGYAKTLTVGLFEAPHRIRKTAGELKNVLSNQQEILFARELTKKFETKYRLVAGAIEPDKLPEKGEYVIIIRAYDGE